MDLLDHVIAERDSLREQVAALTAENARLRAELGAAWTRVNAARGRTGVAFGRDVSIEEMADAAAECGRLRAEVERLNASRMDLCAACQDCPDVLGLRTKLDVASRNFTAALAGLEAERGIHVADLARLTTDAAAECGRLREELERLQVDKRQLLLAFGKWRLTHGLSEFLEMDVDAFLTESREPTTDWPKLCLRLYKENIGDNSFDFTEKDWQGLMNEACTKLIEAGLLKEGE